VFGKKKKTQTEETFRLLADRNEDLREENEELMRKLIKAYERLLAAPEAGRVP
jgi:hypothetical protein